MYNAASVQFTDSTEKLPHDISYNICVGGRLCAVDELAHVELAQLQAEESAIVVIYAEVEEMKKILVAREVAHDPELVENVLVRRTRAFLDCNRGAGTADDCLRIYSEAEGLR